MKDFFFVSFFQGRIEKKNPSVIIKISPTSEKREIARVDRGLFKITLKEFRIKGIRANLHDKVIDLVCFYSPKPPRFENRPRSEKNRFSSN